MGASTTRRRPTGDEKQRDDELGAGSWLHNPATGETAAVRLGPADTAGRRIEAELWLRPGGAVAGPHVHDSVIERFEVLSGEVAFQVGASRRRVGAGAGAVEIAAGTVHDWWNAGEATARVRVEVSAAPDAPGRPAARFVSVIEALWSLAALGQVNAKGMPDLLWLAAIGREYRDVIRFAQPPAWVQSALFTPLAALARGSGRDPLAPHLHGPRAACVIAEPAADGLIAPFDRPSS